MTDDDYPGGWFGASWGAPVCETVSHLPTPGGEPCAAGCGDTIAIGDQGMLIPGIGESKQGKLYAYHLDCFLSDVGILTRQQAATVDVEEVTADEGRAMLDRAARRDLGVSGPEFIDRYRRGDYDQVSGDLHIKVERVLGLLPFAGEQP